MEHGVKALNEVQRDRLIRSEGSMRVIELPETKHVARRLAGFAILLVSVLCAQNCNLILYVASDTLVPYEPIYARAMFVNNDTLPVRLPGPATSALSNSLDFASLVAADGREFRVGPTTRTISCFILHPPADLILPPHESLLSDLRELCTWQRMFRDSPPEPLPEGQYELQAVLNGYKSNVVKLVVRRQRDLSAGAFQAYREILRYSESGAEVSYFRGGLEYRRSIISVLAQELIPSDSLTRFYSIDAQIRLMRSIPMNPYDPVTRRQQTAAARERALDLYRSLGFRYPDSPAATFWFLLGLPGESASAMLQVVATKFPSTVLEREARLALMKIDMDQRRAKK